MVKFRIERLSSLVHDSFTQTFGVVGEDIQSKVTFHSSKNIKSKIKFTDSRCHNILRLSDISINFPFSASKMELDY